MIILAGKHQFDLDFGSRTSTSVLTEVKRSK